MGDDSKESTAKEDVVLLHSRTEDGEGLRALRARDNRLEAAEIRPIRHGQPISKQAELVRLRPRKETPLICDVEVEYNGDSSSDTRSQSSGPPQVASKAYRDNWEQIFGRRRRKRALN